MCVCVCVCVVRSKQEPEVGIFLICSFVSLSLQAGAFVHKSLKHFGLS